MNMKKTLFFGFSVLFLLFLYQSPLIQAQNACSVQEELPTEVKNLTAEAQENGDVLLTWDPATSKNDVIVDYRLYYGNNSVITADDFYAYELLLDQGPLTSYTLKKPEPGLYYFAITAIDSQECESEYYSVEVSVDTSTVKPATQLNDAEINDLFDENVDTVPENTAEAKTPKEAEAPQQGIFLGANKAEAAEAKDETPPKNITHFAISADNFSKTQKLLLSWKKSMSDDAADQILYTNTAGNWDSGYSIGKDITSLEVSAMAGNSYVYRISVIDSSGNESSGVSKSISVQAKKPLSKTGPQNMYIWISILIAIFIGFIIKTKKHSS